MRRLLTQTWKRVLLRSRRLSQPRLQLQLLRPSRRPLRLRWAARWAAQWAALREARQEVALLVEAVVQPAGVA